MHFGSPVIQLEIDSLPLAGGGRFDLAEAGPSLLVVYKESCPTCRLLLPPLVEAYRLSGATLPLLLVSQDDAGVATALVAELGLSVPVLLDGPAYQLSRAIGLAGVPMTTTLEAGSLGDPVEGFDRAAIRGLLVTIARASGTDEAVLAPLDAPGLPDFRPG